MPANPQCPDADPTERHPAATADDAGARGQDHGGRDMFFAAIQMSRMPMILSDPHQEDCPIVFCNRAFEHLTGYAQDEILGHNCRFLQGADTDRGAIDRIRTAIAKQEDFHEDLYNYRKDGSGFWNALFVSPVFGAGGELLYFFASQLDVTRRHEAEAALQHAQRLEALGSMVSGVAHEFNNLMTVMLGSLAQLERGMQEGSRDRQRLDRAKWAATQGGRLTQQMLSFARRQYHDNRSLDLNTVLDDFAGILRQVAGSGVEVTLQLWPEPLMVELDSGQMEMALLNLVRNAADAMPAGGTLVIRTRRDDADGAPQAEIAVQDSGSGMPPDIASRATEPFFTTKPKGAGTGLGLSMVNGFAAQSGGAMAITSQPGQGTTVALRFALQQADR